MCGIAGIYLNTPDDPKLPPTDEREAFINGLFKGIEQRGRDATGVVALQAGATIAHLEKADIPASEFIKWRKPLPDNARIVLCHTRAATQGSPKNLDNNHPVVHKTCYVTHNGHIRNDADLFEDNGITRIAQVDSEIIPALIDKHGLDKVHLALQELEGGFAIAAVQPEKHPDLLVLAKGRNSPLVYIETEQGLIWASLQSTIQDAWKEVWGKAPDGKVFQSLNEGELLYVEDGKIEKLEFKVKQYATTTSSWSGSTGGYSGYSGYSGGYVGGEEYQQRFINTKNHRRTCTCKCSQWKHGSRWENGKSVADNEGFCLTNGCDCKKFEFARFLTKREWRKHDQYKKVQEARAEFEERKRREKEQKKRIDAARDKRLVNTNNWDAGLPEIKGSLKLLYEKGIRKVFDDNKLVAEQFRCDGCESWKTTKGRARQGHYVLCVDCWGEECDLCGVFFDPESLTKIEVGSGVVKEDWFLCKTCYHEANVADDDTFEKFTADAKEVPSWHTATPPADKSDPIGPSFGQSEGLVVDDMALQLAAEEVGCKAPFLYELLFELTEWEIKEETWVERAYHISKPVYVRTLHELRSGLPQTTQRALNAGSENAPRSVGEALTVGGESPNGDECGVRVFMDEE